MKASELKILVKKSLKEIDERNIQNLNEEMEKCTCSDGSTYHSSNCAVTDPCLCDGNCDTPDRIATALGASPVKDMRGMRNEAITYYVCDGCPTSGDTFADDSTCGGGCSGGCTCKEANTGMTAVGGSEDEVGRRRGGGKTANAMFKPAKSIRENKMEKNKLQERFHQLAGIKPLYENEEVESIKEITKEDLLNEGPELWSVLGGLMGVIGAAGITTQLQMMAEDPAIAEKYPKLEKVFSMLAKVGGALGSGIK